MTTVVFALSTLRICFVTHRCIEIAHVWKVTKTLVLAKCRWMHTRANQPRCGSVRLRCPARRHFCGLGLDSPGRESLAVTTVSPLASPVPHGWVDRRERAEAHCPAGFSRGCHERQTGVGRRFGGGGDRRGYHRARCHWLLDGDSRYCEPSTVCGGAFSSDGIVPSIVWRATATRT